MFDQVSRLEVEGHDRVSLLVAVGCLGVSVGYCHDSQYIEAASALMVMMGK